MSEDPATSTNTSPKRVRLSEPNATEKVSNRAKTPKGIALSSISGHTASLHPHVSKLITNYGEKYINNYSKLLQKYQQSKRMSNDGEFIPRSARVNFEFYVRPEIKETDQFKGIQKETEIMVSDFQKHLKSQILRTVEMDIDFLKNDLNKIVCELLHHSVKTFHLLHDPDTVNPSITSTVAHLIHAHGDTLLKHCSLDKNTFKVLYSDLFNDNSITSISSVNQVINADNARNPYARNATLSQNNSILPSHLGIAQQFIDSLRQTLEIVLCTSLDNFNSQVHSNKVASKLEAYSTEVLCEAATSETVEQMEGIPSVTPETMKEMVQKSTDEAMDSLKREIQSLKSRLKNSVANNQKAKNSSQGGRKGASSTKKSKSETNNRNTNVSKSKHSRTQSPKKERKGQDDRDRDSSGNSRNKKPARDNRKTSPRRRRSRSRHRRK